MLTHDNLLWNAINYLERRASDPRPTARSPSPRCSISGRWATLPLLYVGGTVAILPSFDAAQTWRRWPTSAPRCSSWFRHVDALMACPTSKATTCPRSSSHHRRRALPAAGAGVLPGPGVPFQEGWHDRDRPGATLLDADHVRTRRGPSAARCSSADPDRGRERPGGTHRRSGRACAARAERLRRLLGLPDATAEAFRGGWFHTGDLGRVDDEGFITLVDRKKDMIISGGENVYPIEVEQVLWRHEAVREVAVVGVPHPKWEETPIAVVAPRTGGRRLTR